MAISSSLPHIPPFLSTKSPNPISPAIITARNAPTRRISIRCDMAKHHDDDGFYMRRCVELARSALGHTSPNPMVGCVIVRDGKIVGEGFHPKAGQPHAEVFALRDAGELSEGATAYVSLEPCNHFGRTPPCSEALIKARVKRVVVGMTDPNPIVCSKGIERLREEGIEVVTGVEENICRKLNEFFVHRMVTGKPFVTLRYSLTANGQVINQIGSGAAESGGYYSKLLQEYDGVILSGNSAENENYTFLESKEIGAKQPMHIIIAKERNNSPLVLKSLNGEFAPNVVVLADKSFPINANFEFETVVMENLSLNSVLEFCLNKGLLGVLVDFRGDDGIISNLLSDFHEGNLVNKVIMEVLPIWNSEEERYSGLKFGANNMKLKDLSSRSVNRNVLVEGYLC